VRRFSILVKSFAVILFQTERRILFHLIHHSVQQLLYAVGVHFHNGIIINEITGEDLFRDLI